MKYKLINSIITSDYGRSLLKERGVEDYNRFISPGIDCLLEPTLLENIKEGSDLLLKVLNNEKSHIVFILDCDVDGYTSSAILWRYIKRAFPDSNLSYKVHSGKQHGLEDMIEEIERENNADLVILPDAGSNDFEEHERLKSINIPVLILDHHEADIITENAVIINNQQSPNYPNKSLTGAGVVWQFCRYLDIVLNKNYAFEYIDLAALGLISDMASVIDLENRYIIKEGLQNITNYFFQVLREKQSYSLGSQVTPIGVAFYITPMINALIRVGSASEKEKLFLAFIDGTQIVDSTKRGEKGMKEQLAVQVARDCTNARNKQNKIKEQAVSILDSKIAKHELLDNKILFIRLDETDSFPPVLNGLVAMQLAARYKRPTIVARRNNKDMVQGSIRGLNESDLRDFKNFINESKLFEYCEGHANAAGCSIKNNNIEAFHKYANEALVDMDFNENVYDVNFICSANENLYDLVYDLSEIMPTCGQMNSEPLIAVKGLRINTKDIITMGKNQDTVKFIYNDMSYLIFKGKSFLDELEQHHGLLDMTIIGKPNLNEFMGSVTPQIFINEWQLEAANVLDF